MKTVSVRQLLITFVPSIVILVIMLSVSIFFHVSFYTMTRDVAAIAKIHPLSGILSNLGIILWCVAASICFFAALTLRNFKPRDTFWFLFFSALLSTYLLFDDFFQFHEDLVHRYLGLDDKVLYAALAIVVCVYFIAFRRVIWRTNFSVLLLSILFLAASVVIDAISDLWSLGIGGYEYFFEEAAKWLGITCWCSYYVYASYRFLIGTFKLGDLAIQSDAFTSVADGSVIYDLNNSQDFDVSYSHYIPLQKTKAYHYQ